MVYTSTPTGGAIYPVTVGFLPKLDTDPYFQVAKTGAAVSARSGPGTAEDLEQAHQRLQEAARQWRAADFEHTLRRARRPRADRAGS